ncbi:uncharacterized protein UTRI_01181 [Ustilago trichophora]|uniref:Uncharacterized protein n=1 Tax=Ustilago trichophora TaxID=86804 RepID=A0A5C3DVQ2_9BASI|nr:uncharacterized protein UTRI_01181 [Ustilago trichophora]
MCEGRCKNQNDTAALLSKLPSRRHCDSHGHILYRAGVRRAYDTTKAACTFASLASRNAYERRNRDNDECLSLRAGVNPTPSQSSPRASEPLQSVASRLHCKS